MTLLIITSPLLWIGLPSLAFIILYHLIDDRNTYERKSSDPKNPGKFKETRFEAWENAIYERREILRTLKKWNKKQFQKITSDSVYPYIGARKLR